MMYCVQFHTGSHFLSVLSQAHAGHQVVDVVSCTLRLSDRRERHVTQEYQEVIGRHLNFGKAEKFQKTAVVEHK